MEILTAILLWCGQMQVNTVDASVDTCRIHAVSCWNDYQAENLTPMKFTIRCLLSQRADGYQ